MKEQSHSDLILENELGEVPEMIKSVELAFLARKK